MRTAIAACLILAACHNEQNLGDTPTRTVLTSSSGGSQLVNGLALDADHLYWTSADMSVGGDCSPGGCVGYKLDMWRIPREGGAVEQLAQVPVGIAMGPFVIDDAYISTSVMPTTQQAIALIRVPKSGGATEILDDTVGNEGPVAADGQFVYAWYSDTTSSVLRAYPASGGPSAAIIDPFHANSNVLAHDKSLYFVDDLGALVSVPRIGGSPTEIGLGFNYPELVADADNLYVLQRPTSTGGFSSCDGEISVMPFATGTLQPIVSGSCASLMAVTANAIFTMQEEQADAKIVAYDLDGSGERDVLSEPGGVQYFVGDAEDRTLFYNLGDEVISLDFN